MTDFHDIKHLILKNHDVHSCIEYLLDEYEQATFDCYVFSGVRRDEADDRKEIAREGLGEACHCSEDEVHEHVAHYVFMVAPDRFEAEIEEYESGE